MALKYAGLNLGLGFKKTNSVLGLDLDLEKADSDYNTELHKRLIGCF